MRQMDYEKLRNRAIFFLTLAFVPFMFGGSYTGTVKLLESGIHTLLIIQALESIAPVLVAYWRLARR